MPDPRHESQEKLTPPAPLPHVSRRALRRVKQPLPLPTECPYCDGTPRIVDHAVIYGGRRFGEWPYAVACDTCDAYVGLHPHTDIPLGTLADWQLREARKSGKRAFYGLLDAMNWDRPTGYAWLAQQLEIPVSDCHWGWFDVDRCRDAEAAIAQAYGEVER